MNPLYWTLILLFLLGALRNLQYLATGHLEPPTTPRMRAAVVVIHVAFVFWIVLVWK